MVFAGVLEELEVSDLARIHFRVNFLHETTPYHGEEILVADYWLGVLRELLIEAVAEVVGWVGRYYEDLRGTLCYLSGLGQQHCQAAAGGCLADTALPSYEDPSQRLLVQDVLDSGLILLHLMSC